METDKPEPSSLWAKFVDSFEDDKYTVLGDLDETYLTSTEKSIMFKQAANELKLKLKAIRGQKNPNKDKTR